MRTKRGERGTSDKEMVNIMIAHFDSIKSNAKYGDLLFSLCLSALLLLTTTHTSAIHFDKSQSYWILLSRLSMKNYEHMNRLKMVLASE